MDRLATVVRVGAGVQKPCRGVAESPDIHSGRAVLSFSVLVLLLGGQTCLSDALDHGIWDGFSLIVRIESTLLDTLRVGESADIIALHRILALAVCDFFLRSQAGVADMLDILVCMALSMIVIDARRLPLPGMRLRS